MGADLRGAGTGEPHPSRTTRLSQFVIIFGAAVRPDGSPSRAMRGRVDAAIGLAQTWADPVFLPTGAHGEAEAMTRLLVAAGIPRARIRPEPTGRNTLRSVLACARLLREWNGHGSVHVATSAYHMARCVTLLRLAGVRALPGRWPRAPASEAWPKRWRWRLRELPAIPIDSVIVLWLRLRKRL